MKWMILIFEYIYLIYIRFYKLFLLDFINHFYIKYNTKILNIILKY